MYLIRQESNNRLVAGFFEVIETIEQAEKVLKYFQDRIEEKLIIDEILDSNDEIFDLDEKRA
jgi:hypothetical protein